MLKHTRLIALLTALMLVLAACSGDSEPADDGDTGGDTTATTEATTDDTEAPDDTTETTEAMDDGGDLAGTSVNVFGPEAAAEGEAIQAALEPFAAETGIEITYVGAGDFSDQINVQISGGNPPDIAIFPQPGKVADFARSGDILPLPDDVDANVQANWPGNQ